MYQFFLRWIQKQPVNGEHFIKCRLCGELIPLSKCAVQIELKVHFLRCFHDKQKAHYDKCKYFKVCELNHIIPRGDTRHNICNVIAKSRTIPNWYKRLFDDWYVFQGDYSPPCDLLVRDSLTRPYLLRSRDRGLEMANYFLSNIHHFVFQNYSIQVAGSPTWGTGERQQDELQPLRGTSLFNYAAHRQSPAASNCQTSTATTPTYSTIVKRSPSPNITADKQNVANDTTSREATTPPNRYIVTPHAPQKLHKRHRRRLSNISKSQHRVDDHCHGDWTPLTREELESPNPPRVNYMRRLSKPSAETSSNLSLDTLFEEDEDEAELQQEKPKPNSSEIWANPAFDQMFDNTTTTTTRPPSATASRLPSFAALTSGVSPIHHMEVRTEDASDISTSKQERDHITISDNFNHHLLQNTFQYSKPPGANDHNQFQTHYDWSIQHPHASVPEQQQQLHHPHLQQMQQHNVGNGVYVTVPQKPVLVRLYGGGHHTSYVLHCHPTGLMELLPYNGNFLNFDVTEYVPQNFITTEREISTTSTPSTISLTINRN